LIGDLVQADDVKEVRGEVLFAEVPFFHCLDVALANEATLEKLGDR
jgi:hypothetical protein